MQVTDVCCFVQLLNCGEKTPCFVRLKCTKVTICIILGGFCRNGLLIMSFFPSETLGEQTNIIACRNVAGSLDLVCISVSLLPPEDSVYLD